MLPVDVAAELDEGGVWVVLRLEFDDVWDRGCEVPDSEADDVAAGVDAGVEITFPGVDFLIDGLAG